MELSQIVRRIQYQAARLETIEFSIKCSEQEQTSSDQGTNSGLGLLRESLYGGAESCLTASSENLQSQITNLKSIMAVTYNILVGIDDEIRNTITSLGVDLSTSIQAFAELCTSITSELSQLYSELESQEAALFDVASEPSKAEHLLKSLIVKCLGDAEQAERLIQYEIERLPQLTREEAIQAAISRWEDDNR